LNLKVLEVGASALTVYYLSEGLFLTVAESTSVVIASLLPVSLKIEKPMIGHPLDVGSDQAIVIDV